MKCLIIDDELLIRKSLGRALKHHGHESLEAETGLQGLDLWNRGEFDLVFLDMVLPDISGMEVIKRKGTYRSKIFFMTAFSEEAREAIQNFHPDAFLKKPFEDIFDIIKLAEKAVERSA